MTITTCPSCENLKDRMVDFNYSSDICDDCFDKEFDRRQSNPQKYGRPSDTGKDY